MLIRGLLAAFIELGNDEAYYRIFALFPQHGYYDHPPLIAALIRISTWATGTSNEFMIRITSVLFGGINTLIIYGIAKNPIFRPQSIAHTLSPLNQSDFRRGFIASALYTGSIYASIICGTFIMPDTPLSLCWLSAIYFATITFPSRRASRYKILNMLFFGLMCGLAIVSKYTGLYLVGASFFYIVLFYRDFFFRISLYTSLAIAFLTVAPILDWNIANDFISFKLQGSRVIGGDFSITPLFFIREFFGSLFYNGLFNIAIIFLSFWFYFRRGQRFLSPTGMRILMLFSVPFILIFSVISLFKATLPHWSAPGFFGLLIFGSCWLNTLNWRIIRRWLTLSIGSTLLIVFCGVLQICFGLFIGPDSSSDYRTLGRNDISLDMYGWGQLGDHFSVLLSSDIASGVMPNDTDSIYIYSSKWYEAAHLDTYLAVPNNLYLKTVEFPSDRNLFYEFASEMRGNHLDICSGYYIVSSRLYNSESAVCQKFGISDSTSHIVVPITRCRDTVMNFMIYRIRPRN